MAFVHARHVLHGDLKPQNILVDENDVAYVADFGLSKIKESTKMMVTRNVTKNTRIYASPELLLYVARK